MFCSYDVAVNMEMTATSTPCIDELSLCNTAFSTTAH